MREAVAGEAALLLGYGAYLGLVEVLLQELEQPELISCVLLHDLQHLRRNRKVRAGSKNRRGASAFSLTLRGEDARWTEKTGCARLGGEKGLRGLLSLR